MYTVFRQMFKITDNGKMQHIQTDIVGIYKTKAEAVAILNDVLKETEIPEEDISEHCYPTQYSDVLIPVNVNGYYDDTGKPGYLRRYAINIFTPQTCQTMEVEHE